MEKRDGELVAHARGGDKKAFGQLIGRYQARALRVALGMVASEEAARDLAQEAMLQAYLSLDRLREDASFANWLHGIVVNVCRRYLRERQRECVAWEGLEAEPGGMLPAVPDPEAVAEQRERERMANLDIAEQHAPQQGHASIEHKGRVYDMLISVEPTELGEKLTLRLEQKEVAGEEA